MLAPSSGMEIDIPIELESLIDNPNVFNFQKFHALPNSVVTAEIPEKW